MHTHKLASKPAQSKLEQSGVAWLAQSVYNGTAQSVYDILPKGRLPDVRVFF